ncbi:transposable element Tcb2 transposase [Trichonephila clavipes]|nr:transposable element Tcb2 transposase [Trichonephila clavipes]
MEGKSCVWAEDDVVTAVGMFVLRLDDSGARHILESYEWGCKQLIHLGSRLQTVEVCPTDAHLEQDWACLLFSDESRFSLLADCRRQLIWRESGTAYRPENIQEKDRYPTCSIMVWASNMINGRTRLHVVANGTMTGQRYIDDVLLPHVHLFRGAVDSVGIQRVVWLARSPDLNPIVNVWDALLRQVAGRNYPPTNKKTLIRALTDEWDKLPQQLLDNVVQSMVRRVECCITLHGEHIPY